MSDLTDYDSEDIDPGMSTTNYQYDGEGRLVSDDQEEIHNITWRVDGKVSKIEHNSGSGKKNLSFDYDAMGHRIAKHVYDDSWSLEKSTYYLLDAQGNTMSVYEYVVDAGSSTVTYAQEEKYIYGSSRVGVLKETVYLLGSVTLTDDMSHQVHITGQRSYELTNHLGNVLSVISDKVIPHDDDSDGFADWYLADILQSTDYSPFGVTLHGRNFTKTGAEKFRFGFQGQEMDDEIKGEGNSVNFEYRMFDPRLGRFFALDPLATKYPYWSPFVFSGNQVIRTIEIEGLEPENNTNEVENVKNLEEVQICAANFPSGSQVGYMENCWAPVQILSSSHQADLFAQSTNSPIEYFRKNGQLSNVQAPGAHNDIDGGYCVVTICRNSDLGIAIETKLKTKYGIDVSKLSRKERKGLFELRWEKDTDYSELFSYNNCEMLANVMALPTPVAVTGPVPVTLPGEGIGGSDIYISTDHVAALIALKYSSSSGKNEKHGDSGRAVGKSEKQIADLEAQLQNLSGREKKKVEQKIKNIKRAAEKAKKGEEHSNANKR